MARYLTFFTYTGEAAARMVQRPGDREAAARALIQEAGGRLESFYWMFGDHDGLIIYEVADAATAAAVCLAVSRSGLIAALKTHQLLAPDEIRTSLGMARAVERAYDIPGGRGPWHDEYTSRG
jgi:uncharacterized protein with GYD domain